MVPATAEYMRLLRDETQRRGIVLVQDEVITFRVAYGGLQSLYDVDPDVIAVAKIIGGGFPVGAFGGRSEIMEVFDPRGADPVSHGGTFSANPVTMRAGLKAMQMLTVEELGRINALGDRLRSELIARGWKVSGMGSLLRIDFGEVPEVWWNLYEAGVFISPTGLACISTPMDDSVIDEVLAAFSRVRG